MVERRGEGAPRFSILLKPPSFREPHFRRSDSALRLEGQEHISGKRGWRRLEGAADNARSHGLKVTTHFPERTLLLTTHNRDRYFHPRPSDLGI